LQYDIAINDFINQYINILFGIKVQEFLETAADSTAADSTSRQQIDGIIIIMVLIEY
jgi:hypothetical protein